MKYIFIYIYSCIYITATSNVSQAIFSRCIIAESLQQHNTRIFLIKALKMRPVGQGYDTGSWPRSGTVCSSLTYVNMQRQISANLHFNQSIFFLLAEILFTMQNSVRCTARWKWVLHQHNLLLFQYLVKCLLLTVTICALKQTMSIQWPS